MIHVEPLDDSPQAGAALEALLHETYVRGGFTDASLAHTLLAAAVRSRGEVLAALDETGTLLGTVTLVRHGSPATRLATPEEVELHLLCVRPDARRRGIGEALVLDALRRAKADGARGVVLWTQPTMDAAQRLYRRCGFERDTSADFRRGARQFLVHRYAFAEEGARARSKLPAPSR
jgi:ribosomal protein S18 acetylase RimI-like enzyme